MMFSGSLQTAVSMRKMDCTRFENRIKYSSIFLIGTNSKSDKSLNIIWRGKGRRFFSVNDDEYRM